MIGGLFAMSNLAIAADLPAPAPAAPPSPIAVPPSWTGVYLGIEGGGIVGNSNQIANGPLGFGPISSGYTVTGGLVGGTAGFNWQTGDWVFGLEGDMSWADVRGSANEAPPFTSGSVIDTKENWLATGRGRIGWTTSNSIMFFATGGFAAAAVEADIMPPTAAERSETDTRWGGTVGGGVEAKLTPNWSAKAEYLYTKFASQGYFSNPPPGTNIRSDVPLNNNIFRFGINYAFQ
ncbi:MAG: outer membrane beta-barrel protein [Xanthobacteraceae bacterium]